jgi:hypothetical protein
MKAILKKKELKIFNPKRKNRESIEIDFLNTIDTDSGRFWVGIFSKRRYYLLTKFVYLVNYIRFGGKSIINREVQ